MSRDVISDFLAHDVERQARKTEGVGVANSYPDRPSEAPRLTPRPGADTIAFVINHDYVDALACFREPIKTLADRGWNVDVFTLITSHKAAPDFGRDRVRLIPLEMSRSGVVALAGRLLTRARRYRAIFTVPQWGLHHSTRIAGLAGIPVVCISDEIITDAEAPLRGGARWKARERAAHRRCAFTIALSPERAEFIRAENRLGPSHPMVIVPNSVAGPARRERSRFYQDRLTIPEGAFVVLHAGGLGWPPVQDLIRQAPSWRLADVHYVFQGRLRSEMRGRANTAIVRFHEQVLPSALLDYATSSADLGLALYPSGKMNDRLMGTASGKLALYMKNALPVITTNQDCFQWVEKSGCGVRIAHVGEIPAAIDRIRTRYEWYVDNVRKWYAGHLDFERYFAPVEASLGVVPAGSAPAREQP